MRLEIAVLGLLLLLAGLLHACISLPYIEVGEHQLPVIFGDLKRYAGLPGDYPLENISTDVFDGYMTHFYGSYWTSANLTPAEKASAWEFVKHGYSAKRMTAEEYEEFKAHALAVNSNLSTCGYYSALAYKDGFAGFVFNDESNKTPACASAPRRLCGGGFVLPYINDLGPEGAPSVESPTQDREKQGLVNESSPPITESKDQLLQVAFAAVSIGVLLLFTAFVVLSILNRRPPEPEHDEAEMHRTLSSETRIALLRELRQRDLTPTDLSLRLGKSKATVVEHLNKLVEAGFVEKKEEEGKKFVFYRLTRKGKAVLGAGG